MEAIGGSVLSGIGALIVRKLDTFLSQEAKLFLGIGEDIKDIKDEVQCATAFLKEMYSQSITEDGSSELLNQWLHQVKDLIYEAEDVLDEYKYYTAQRGNKCHLLRRLKDVIAYHDFASQLNKLKLEVKDVKERPERCNASAGTAGHTHSANTTNGTSSLKPANMPDPRLRFHYVQKDKLVAIASQRDEIINWLVGDDTPQLRVISIVGPGGMGKTTLAMQSYESPQVTNGQFSCRAHITVSQAFDFNKLMRSLFRQFLGDEFAATTEKMEAEDLVMEMGKQLSKKRYLVLLDDVWTVEAWSAFSDAFPDNGNGSRIIVITRIDAVANTCSFRDRRYVYRIQHLSLEQSKELFCKRVFLVPPFTCPPYLEKLMEGILKQCGGMPLAIVTVAGILVYNNQSKEHWQRVHDHIGLEWEDGAENMKRILMLSYNDLPYEIKPCFLYLSMFPKDAELKRSDVVRRWIAEGLVSGSDAEQRARSYFDELASRNLIDPSIIICGNGKLWKIHGMIPELIVGKTVKENFAYIKNKTPHGSKIRCIYVHGEVNTLNGLDLSLARSLSLRFASHRYINPKMLNFKKMRLLRILDLEGYWFIKDQDVEQICETLLLLKHLCLRSTRISKLPESIDMLKDLEVLDIRGTLVEELPRSFFSLRKLNHFITDKWMDEEEIIKLGRMRSLHALNVTVDVLSARALDAIGKLVHIKKLEIMDCNGRKKDSAEIWKRRFLQALKDLSNSSLRSLTIISHNQDVHFTDDDSLPSLTFETMRYFGVFASKGVPKWVESLHRVTKMSLVFFASTIESQQNGIRILGSLSTLVSLRLFIRDRRENQDVTIDTIIGSEGFENLKSLDIRCQHDYFPKIIFVKGALPSLEYLLLRPLPKPEIEGKVLGIENLAKLKEVTCSSSDIKTI